MSQIVKIVLALVCAVQCVCTAAAAEGRFPLIRDGRAAAVYYAGREQVIATALEIYAADMRQVAGRTPERLEAIKPGCVVVVALTNPGQRALLRTWGVSTAKVEGRWEAFRICEASKGGKHALFVVGSDPRGAAYGVLELSRLAGVSPWEWWADVTPRAVTDLSLPAGYDRTEAPSVQYRGIFLNDEDWGLDPWGTRFEGSTVAGELGSKTHSRIFELLLRLRANTFWPAMHASTVAFYRVKGNREVAERYGIVVGTSHCEPMMRNNVGEWDHARGEYDFTSNRDSVLAYWRERVRELSGDENIFTLGMRGIHDGRMSGAETLDEQTQLTGEVIRAQREMLAAELKCGVEKIPQTFVPYKEVLDIYNNGIKIPDDVTLVWCDDNYGYLTRLSNAAERARSGGAGVYYHVSYYGKPHDYLWLATSQPALMASEMQRAWDYGARRLWVLNVGDLKPAEYHTELFMDMAWKVADAAPERAAAHLERWLEREFGASVAPRAAALMAEHYRLAAERKPEHMGWSRIQQPRHPGGITPVTDTQYDTFSAEAFGRVDAYEALRREAARLGEMLPADRRDAWFELVQYPVEGAALMNRKWLHAQHARRYAAQGLAAWTDYAASACKAYDTIRLLTARYNEQIAGGKWRDMMSMNPRNLPVFAAPEFKPAKTAQQETQLWADGQAAPAGEQRAQLPAFVRSADNSVSIHVFYANSDEQAVVIGGDPEWLRVERRRMSPLHERLILRVSYDDALADGAELCVTAGMKAYRFAVRRCDDGQQIGAPMVDGVASLAGAAYDKIDAEAVVIPGLGQSGRAVRLPKACRAEYLLRCDADADYDLTACFLPTHPAESTALRFRVSVDGVEAGVADIREVFGEEPWKVNVLRNQARRSFRMRLPKGVHRVSVEPLDEAMLLDGLYLSRNGRDPYILPGFTK